jgi:hypothetical protein
MPLYITKPMKITGAAFAGLTIGVYLAIKATIFLFERNTLSGAVLMVLALAAFAFTLVELENSNKPVTVSNGTTWTVRADEASLAAAREAIEALRADGAIRELGIAYSINKVGRVGSFQRYKDADGQWRTCIAIDVAGSHFPRLGTEGDISFEDGYAEDYQDATEKAS